MSPVVVGVLIGIVRGGRLLSVRLRGLWMLWIAAAIQVAQYRAPGVRDLIQNRLGVSFLVPIFALVAVFIWYNTAPRGGLTARPAVFVTSGLVANAVALSANGGRMPWWPTAARWAHMSAKTTAAATKSPKNQPAGSGTHLRWLGDVIPLPGLHMVMSIGDAGIMLGTVLGVTALMLRPDSGRVGDLAR